LKRHVILAGATGLIGGHVVRFLVDAGHDVTCILRRPNDHLPKAARQIVADIEQWPDCIAMEKPDVAISCLGTTMRDAGSKAAFAAVDLDLVTAFATAAKQSGAGHFIAVSSVGADHASSNFYLATKGKAELQIGALGFTRTDFIRPGLLRGNRGGPPRIGEQAGILLSPLFDMLMMGALSRYRSIDAKTVAQAITTLCTKGGQGSFIHENRMIIGLAG
jgi:uncharacterized protein YbjT (DUF2867 family)